MKTEWIWTKDGAREADSYASFKCSFSGATGAISLKVSCDSVFCACLNGEVVLFSGCADYPHYKLYDECDISEHVAKENELEIVVWYVGTDSQTYIHSDPGLWFEVIAEGEVIAASSAETLSRPNLSFKHGYKKMITHQLGYSFYYDNTASNDIPWTKSIIIEKLAPVKRQQKSLVLDGRIPATYTEVDGHVLVDFGREVAGYVDVEFYSPIEQELLITFGEHLETGKVSREIGGRDFSFEFKAKKGKNKWFCPLRRLACRYFEIYSKKPINIDYFGMQHVYYPVEERKRKVDDPLLRRIYDVSVRTLRLCMHEHYEDCPWREQALYALDSRNQMLFGYKAFFGTEYQRSNLLLINQGLRPDGLLAICFPAGSDVPIPFFSLAFILEVCEYVKETGDRSIIEQTKETVSTIISTFQKSRDKCGLIPAFKPPFWNFYEWSEGNDGDLSGVGKVEFKERCELILNAMYVYVLNVYNETAGTSYDTESVKQAIKENLYLEDKGVYKISTNGTLVGQLGNALAILAGLGNAALAEKVAECKNMTPATLSMKPFVYDALLTEGDKYKNFIIEDIKRVYGAMLDYGATSFWETELGWRDFDFAGSLCHGWSASPVYYLSILGLANEE